MKIRIELEIEVDVAGWMLDYGIPKDEVGADVKEYVKLYIQEMPNGNIKTVNGRVR